MCGIAGRAHFGESSRENILRMIKTLEHRGPDEAGHFVGKNIELGMRRLAIQDVLHGQQPVFDESENLALVFNGEIYNFKELSKKLLSRGHTLKSDSDSEVIVHLFEEYGTEAFKMLRGMFAIAIWDKRTEVLTLGRDRIGKKPLMYASINGSFYFASETRAILAVISKPEVNFSAINHVLEFGYIPAPINAFQGISSLEPGHYLTWQEGSISTEKYWEIPSGSSKPMSYEESLEGARKVIEESVELRMISERPIGSFLSGGIDSTVVTALMARRSGSNVQTFSIGFENEKFDESRYAKKVADHLGTKHHELIVNPNPALLLQELGNTFDQPFADSSAIPTYLVSEFARNNLVVALTGDGGDEVFSGYTRYKALPQVQKFNQLLTLFGPLKSISLDLAKKYGNRRFERLIEELSPAKNLQERYSIAMSLFEPHLLKEIWANSEGLSASDEPAKWFSRLWAHSEKLSLNNIETMSTMDMRSYLPGDLLVKVDIASMANSIETRSPLLDHNVIEFAASIPYEYRMKNGEPKHVLRQIARDLVPAQLIDRPKMGFAIPRAEWLRGPLREMSLDLLTDSTFRSRGWFNPIYVQGLLQKHSGGRDQDEQIWPLLMIELWAREWID